MPTVYERVVDDRVVERVQPVPGDFEDTRLGVAVLDGTGGWRIASDAPTPVGAAAPRANETDAAVAPPAEPAIPSPAEPADEPDTAEPARPATRKEK